MTFKFEKTDLRAITRRSKVCQTIVTIELDWNKKVEWLQFGEAQLRKNDRRQTYRLEAYGPAGVTDFEHDSIYVLSLPLVGVQLDDLLVSYHRTNLIAWVESDFESFRVPTAGYNPMKMKGAYECTSEDKPHMIVPEGYYKPQHNKELFDLVRGKRVEIQIGLVKE